MIPHFTPAAAALLLIDFQVGTLQLARTTPADEALRNAAILAKTARILNMPIIMTASQEGRVQGPTDERFKRIAPEAYEARILRTGVIDAWKDENFRKAVEATGRRQLIMAAITTDICLVFPAVSATEEGYEVQAVMDASSSPYRINEDISRRRLERAGVLLTVMTTMTAELIGDWSSEAGQKIMPFLPVPALMMPVD